MSKKFRRITGVLILLMIAVMAYFLYDSLRERTRAEKLAHIIHLEDRRLLTSELTDYLSNPSPEIRGLAALATGRIGGPGSARQLLPLLEDSSLEVASIAAFAIGLSGESELAVTLTDIGLDLPSSVAAAAVKSAGRLADSSMAEVVANLSGYLSHPSPEVREAACFGLFFAGARSAAPEVMTLLASERDPEVRLAALYMLARLGIEEAGEIFVGFLAESDPFTRSLALRGLSQSKIDRAGHYLAIALNDDDPQVVAQAIAGLTNLGSDTISLGSGKRGQADAAVSKLAEKLTRATDEKLVVALIDGLRRCRSELGINEVLGRLKAGAPDNVVAAAVRYLAVARGDRAVNLIDSLLAGRPHARLRAACVEAFGLIDTPGILPRLAVLFGDEDPMVRAAAFGVLISKDSTNADFYIDKALNDLDWVPVSLAVDEIGYGMRRAYLPVLRTLISNPEETELDIKRSVLAATIPFLEKDKEDSLVTEILLAGLLDTDYIVRKDAAAIYSEKLSTDHHRLVGPARTRIKERDIEKAIEKYVVNLMAEVVTTKGTFDFELLFDEAPLTVMNFIELAESGFYDGLALHRVIPNFVAQGGDPRGDGWGGPPYTIRCEYSDQPYDRGTVGIATSGKDTGGSQFFITFSPQPHLDARYTVFGRVLNGMDVVDQLVVGDLVEQILIRDGQL